MLLTDLLKRYCDEHEDGIKTSTVDCWYKPAIADLKRHLNRDPTTEDLTTAVINEWIETRKAAAKSLNTIKTRRSAIMALWRWAYQESIATEEPKKVRRVRVPKSNPEAWSPVEVSALIKTALKRRWRCFKGHEIAHGVFFASLFAAAWDSGLRLGDLLEISPGDLVRTENGVARLIWTMEKTQYTVRARLGPETMRLVDECLAYVPDRELIWPLWCRREQFYKHVRNMVAAAGIDDGTTRFIRRGAVTEAENIKPGLGSVLAGHRNPQVARDHYIDQRKIRHVDVELPSVVSVSEPMLIPFRPTTGTTAEHRTIIDRLNVRAEQLRAAIEPARTALEAAQTTNVNQVVLRDARTTLENRQAAYARLCAQMETVLHAVESQSAGSTLSAFHQVRSQREGG